MASDNKYTVIELSDKLSVPRTTITDWLVRYATFIDFKIQGKRKIYTDKSIEVLVEIKDLRDKGLSSFDIEEELAKRHPIHGELSGATASMMNTESKNEDSPHGEQIVSRQNGNSDIGEMLRNMLIEMTRRMDEIELQNKVNLGRTTKWNIIAFIMILTLAGVSIFGFLMIKGITEEKEGLDKEKQQYMSLSQSLSGDLTEATNEKKLVEKKLIEINENHTVLESELARIKNDTEKQNNEFENLLKNSIKDSELSKEVEILKLRDKFAEERLKFLEEIEQAKNSREEMVILVAKLQAQNHEQNSTIEKLINAKNSETVPSPQENKK